MILTLLWNQYGVRTWGEPDLEEGTPPLWFGFQDNLNRWGGEQAGSGEVGVFASDFSLGKLGEERC